MGYVSQSKSVEKKHSDMKLFKIQIFKLKPEQKACYFDWNIQKTLTEIGTQVTVLISGPGNFTGEL